MKIVERAETPYLGVFSIDDLRENSNNFSSNSGSTPALAHTHVDWSGTNPDGSQRMFSFTEPYPELFGSVADVAADLARTGTVMAVSWDPFGLDHLSDGLYDGTEVPAISAGSILRGDHDAFIRQVAQEVAGFDLPIMMSLFGEANSAAIFAYGPEGNSFRDRLDDMTGQYGDPTLPDGPERVRDVFRHVIDIFNEEGADNVSWFQYMASDSGIDPESVPFDVFYPGDDYIDWVGQSVYVESAAGLGASLDTGYAAWGEVTDKPFFVPELGNVSTGGAEVAALLEGLASYDRMGAITWTDFEGATDFYGVPRLGTGAGEWDVIRSSGYADIPVINAAEGVFDLDEWRDLTGRSEEDYFFRGTSGSDYVVGESAEDTLIGQGGDDFYIIDGEFDRIIEEADGGYDFASASVSYSMHGSVEGLILTGSAAINGRGNVMDNTILGNGANNIIWGRDGNDTILAGDGDDLVMGEGDDDTLMGDKGNDTLLGDAGADVLLGGAGNDRLTGGSSVDVLDGGVGDDWLYLDIGEDLAIGGAGRDTFVFGATGGIGIIQDFETGADLLDLSVHGMTSLQDFREASVSLDEGMLITAGSHSLYIEGVAVTDITADMLIF